MVLPLRAVVPHMDGGCMPQVSARREKQKAWEEHLGEMFSQFGVDQVSSRRWEGRVKLSTEELLELTHDGTRCPLDGELKCPLSSSCVGIHCLLEGDHRQ